jgi:hypothetical protein
VFVATPVADKAAPVWTGGHQSDVHPPFGIIWRYFNDGKDLALKKYVPPGTMIYNGYFKMNMIIIREYATTIIRCMRLHNIWSRDLAWELMQEKRRKK